MIACFTHCGPSGGYRLRFGDLSAPLAQSSIAALVMLSACLGFGRFTGIERRVLDRFGDLLRHAASEAPQ